MKCFSCSTLSILVIEIIFVFLKKNIWRVKYWRTAYKSPNLPIFHTPTYKTLKLLVDCLQFHHSFYPLLLNCSFLLINRNILLCQHINNTAGHHTPLLLSGYVNYMFVITLLRKDHEINNEPDQGANQIHSNLCKTHLSKLIHLLNFFH